MSIETALRAYVLADAGVATLAGTRMYPRNLPQGPTFPALVYQRVDTRRRHVMEGPDGLPRTRMQITCWGTSAQTVTELAATVRGRLDGFRGVWGTERIGACLCVGERDIDDPETGRLGVAQDYMIQYEEA